jgi:hypothetical protein
MVNGGLPYLRFVEAHHFQPSGGVEGWGTCARTSISDRKKVYSKDIAAALHSHTASGRHIQNNLPLILSYAYDYKKSQRIMTVGDYAYTDDRVIFSRRTSYRMYQPIRCKNAKKRTTRTF